MSLARMHKWGINVLPAFVVPSTIFFDFLHKNELIDHIERLLKSVPLDIRSIEEISKQIQTIVLDAEIPESVILLIKEKFVELGTQYVAVRSSAVDEDSKDRAWAGQLDTFLNSSAENLIENIKKCWMSQYSARAILYRIKNDIGLATLPMGVLVQTMIQSDVAGVAFSINPVTHDDEIVVEASFGLGESVVSGKISPDTYILQKHPLLIRDKMIHVKKQLYGKDQYGVTGWHELAMETGSKESLSETELMNLARQVLTIELKAGFPVDVEWGICMGTLFVNQYRPITT